MMQHPAHRPPRGPHPGILAAISFGLFAASLVVSAILTGGQSVISPFSSTDGVVAFFRDHGEVVAFSSMLQLGSAVPLAICAATIYTRMLHLGARVPGPAIAFVGGLTAALTLMFSAFAWWTLSRPEVTIDATLTHALAFLSFVAGGVGFSTGMGLLIAGLAVPLLILRLAPAWLAWSGLVIAALAEMSFLSMTLEPLHVLIPIARFAGLPWLVVAGFLLPQTRAEARQQGNTVAASRA
jgi:hypothetical protein